MQMRPRGDISKVAVRDGAAKRFENANFHDHTLKAARRLAIKSRRYSFTLKGTANLLIPGSPLHSDTRGTNVVCTLQLLKSIHTRTTKFDTFADVLLIPGEYPSDWRPVQYSRELSQAIQELHKPHAAAMRMTLGRL